MLINGKEQKTTHLGTPYLIKKAKNVNQKKTEYSTNSAGSTEWLLSKNTKRMTLSHCTELKCKMIKNLSMYPDSRNVIEEKCDKLLNLFVQEKCF